MAAIVSRRRPSELAPLTTTPLSPSILSPRYKPEPTTLLDLLENAARSAKECILFSASGRSVNKSISYASLYNTARAKAPIVAALAMSHQQGSSTPIVLLHFDNMEDNITWFWASIMAGLDVAISTPLPQNMDQRRKHLTHVAALLDQPVVLTSSKLLADLQETEGFHTTTVESLNEALQNTANPAYDFGRENKSKVLMLTSGSSGNSKAVELEATQIIAAMKNKSGLLDSHKRDVFLNWIGFDHVASLTECHLHAMFLGAEQIHVHASEVINDPWLFLSIVNRYRVTASFAPNFFLARLLTAVEESPVPSSLLDLSCLRRINSGGEANIVDTAARLTKALAKYGASDSFIHPGFGMTETCAGAIQNRECPAYDVKKEYEFASLGVAGPGIQMRIMKPCGNVAAPNQVGVLQISGPVVFKKYHNNPKATAEAFTEDGWFNTGDKAFIDDNGRLCLSGRDKEVINLNGVKYFPHEVESALEEQGEAFGISPSYTAIFSIRPQNATYEEICVLYNPTFPLEDLDARIKASQEITRVVGERTSARPKHVVALPRNLMPKSALGKLSRTKLREALEKGEFAQYEDRLNTELQARREALCEPPATETEKFVLDEVNAVLTNVFDGLPLGVNNSIFDYGITSTDLFILKQRVEKRANISNPIPIGTFLSEPTVRGIAIEIEKLKDQAEFEYSHFVPLQTEGTKAPLFLIHPGSGDVLIFVHLAKYFPDRPVYGIRTRALYEGDNYFETIYEMAETYMKGIKEIQPEGPYAIAGYSLGSTVAFEVAKKLEANGDRVPFCGVLDSPPHFRHLVSHLGFVDVLINVAYFLELITEEYAVAGQVSLTELSDDEALQTVLDNAPPKRLEVLGIGMERLRKITNVTWSFGKAAKDYDPLGSVQNLDIFWVHPLLWVAKSRDEWMEKHLRHWVDFCETEPRFHACEGIHSLMLNGDYVDGVAKKMRKVLQEREV